MVNDGAIIHFFLWAEIFLNWRCGQAHQNHEVKSSQSTIKTVKVFKPSTTYSMTPLLSMTNWYPVYGSSADVSFWVRVHRVWNGGNICVRPWVSLIRLRLIDWLITIGFFGLLNILAKVPLRKTFFSLRTSFALPWYFSSWSQTDYPIDYFGHEICICPRIFLLELGHIHHSGLRM